jgi:osmotically-inducible protein OsmY
MNASQDMITKIRAILEKEARVNLHHFPIRIDFADGTVTLEGEVENIAAKKMALERAASVRGVNGVVDRLRVRPSERLGDGAIRDLVQGTLMREPALQGYTIDVEVDDGVITLNGEVPSLSHKRIAGVLAWWTRGRRDVINGLEVVPPQQDNDAEVTDAVRLVLERDPFVAADRILVSTRNYVVNLDGSVANDIERNMAEHDAWYVFGVDNVINRLQVK